MSRVNRLSTERTEIHLIGWSVRVRMLRGERKEEEEG